MKSVETLEKIEEQAKLSLESTEKLERMLLDHYEETNSNVIFKLYEDVQSHAIPLLHIKRDVERIKDNEIVANRILAELKDGEK